MFLEIPYDNPLELFSHFSGLPGSILLHSAMQMPDADVMFYGNRPFSNINKAKIKRC